ncbi:MAG: hypothetical protein NZV61_08505 [Candidatus Bipolaricaulota bacterium]|nr:hypothetical protein [Candidatus Bipolaricaulota bacterium]
MSVEVKPLAELTQEAIQILYRELGVINTVRFLRQFTVGFGNYVEERETLLANKSLNDILEEIKSHRKNR